jgi:holo-[acyl-carrier protein] synthase
VIVGSGIDVVEIARIQRALDRSGERFVRRVFAGPEIDACSAHARPAALYSMCFAAKEAVLKALGTGWSAGARWVEIETLPQASGAPSLRLHGRVAELAVERGAALQHLALSRSRSHAIAMALFEGGSR